MAAYYQIEDKYLLSPTNLNYADAGKALAWDVQGVLNAYFNPIVYQDPTTATYLAGKYWDVEEKVCTGFLRGDLDHDISDTVTMRGNVGVQVIHTDQGSGSYRVDTDTNMCTGIDGGKDIHGLLPQINLAFMLPDSQAVSA